MLLADGCEGYMTLIEAICAGVLQAICTQMWAACHVVSFGLLLAIDLFRLNCAAYHNTAVRTI